MAEHVSPAMSYDGGDFTAWQHRARTALADLIRFDPDHAPAIDTRHVWTRPHRLGQIQKLMLVGDDGVEVPIYWCLPEAGQARRPAMICLQGHTTGMHCSIGVSQANEMVDEPVAGDRDFALQCMAHGVAAVCVEQRGFGERRDDFTQRTDCQHMAMRALMLGRTLVGERVADVALACRWLLEREEVDPQRVGVMGNSAGGTTAMYAAAMIDAIRLLVQSCSFGFLRDTWFTGRRCVCGYVPDMMPALDLPDVVALRAPKPVIIVGGATDYHCPAEPLEQAFTVLRQRYEAAGAAAACELVVGPEGHRFYAELAWPRIMAWL